MNEQAWIDAKRKYRRANEVMAMAKRLGMNPKEFGVLPSHAGTIEKPLPDFIRTLYEKHFGEDRL